MANLIINKAHTIDPFVLTEETRNRQSMSLHCEYIHYGIHVSQMLSLFALCASVN